MEMYFPILASFFFLLFTTILPARTLTDLSVESLTTNSNMDCRQQDSLVLVELYEATNANGWTNPWDLSQPMDTWYGVSLNVDGCVEVLDLDGYIGADCQICGGGNNLTGTIPFSVWDLVHLKTLSFSFNFSSRLDSLPYDIGKISKLEVLSLKQLKIGGHIPNSIGSLSNLYHIILSTNNLIGDIPTSMNNLTKLTYLSLSGNQLTNLPDLSNSLGLRDFFLNGNPLGGTIPDWLGLLTNLQSIDWSNCQLEGTIPDFWDGFNTLHLLNLSNNQLIGNIPINLGTTSIDLLRLSNNKLDELIPSFVGVATSLRDLDVRNNQLTFEDLLLNFNANETLINANANNEYDKYDYQPQQPIGTTTSLNFIAGQDYSFDLNIDDTVTTNVYKWHKNGALFQTNIGNNTLNLSNVTTEDIGTYTCEVTNPAIPDLTLESHPYRLSVIDFDCRMKDSLVLVDLYNATNGANWTNTWDLNQPMTTWYGITLSIDGCVETIDLDGYLFSVCEGCTQGGNNLNGTLPVNFWDLTHLTKLSLGGNTNLILTIPAEIGNIKNLKILNLAFMPLSGTIPTELGNLTQLIELVLRSTQLTGAIPNSFNNLTQLTTLNLERCQLNSLPDLSNLNNLTSLVLANNPFNTTLPSWLGDLTTLSYLDLDENGWTGAIPPNIGNLTKLTQLYLRNNQLTGVIPNSFSNLEDLVILFLQNNQLEGSIPVALGNLDKLALLDFSNNNFSGTIPDFSNTDLDQSNLNSNQFTFKDILPNLVANRTKITNRGGNPDNFVYNPQQKIGEATNLEFTTGDNQLVNLNIDNFITSNVYNWYKDEVFLQTVNGNSNLTLSNLSETDAGVYTCKVTNPNAPDLTLESHPFTLSYVDANCRMRDSLILVDLYTATGGANWTNIWDLNQSMDTWHGVFMNEFGCVTRLDLDGNVDAICTVCEGNGNNLMGTIPATLWNLSELRILSFSNNPELSTTSFPTAVTDLVKLEYLNLGSVALNGNIPTEIEHLSNLETLIFRNCNLNGTIPDQIGSLTKLRSLNLFSSGLTGAIPYSLNNLSQLSFINLGSNQLTGITDLSSLKSLVTLNISFNPFGGTIPLWLTNLSSLTHLNLAGNQLTGEIPDFWIDLPNLESLDLSFNELTGTIPASIATTKIRFLRLVNNQLVGDFPAFLSTISTLTDLNIAENNFGELIPDFSTTATNFSDLEIQNNQFTFEDIIPHFTANKNIIAANGGGESYTYQPQAKIGTLTSINVAEGTDYTFDLGIDDTVTTNTYNWFKNGQAYQTIQGNNELTITNASIADLGTYTCEVTNSIATDLTLESHPYTLSIFDPECRMKDSLVLVELYNATGGANWNNTWDLNQPMTTWYGVELTINGCVSVLDLDGFMGGCFVCGGGNNLVGTLPTTIWNLKNLTHLSFGRNNQLQMTISTQIGELLELQILSLPDIGVSGSLPSEIGNLTQLTGLYLGGNAFSGIIPSSLGNLINLEVLILSYNQFTSIPDLSSLTKLGNLNISGNNFGGGGIPSWISSLSQLWTLSLNSNNWAGTIPAEIGNLNQLRIFNLGDNQLEGGIPNSFSNLNLIHTLSLRNNQLSGILPSFLEDLPALGRLDLYDNNFTGLIPDLGTTQMIDLDVGENALTFKDIIPNIASIDAAILNNTSNPARDSFRYDPQPKIGSETTIPFILGNDYSINLNIDNFITSNAYTWYKDGNFHQTVNGIPILPINNASAADIGVYTCQVTNPNAPDLTLESYPYTLRLIDTECRMQDSLVLVDLYNATGGVNWANTWDLSQPMATWYGVTLNEDGCVIGLDLDGHANDNNCINCQYNGNNLVGTIPNTLWNLDNLVELSLGDNSELNGNLPAAINNLVNLTLLNFRDANLSGDIPEEIGDLTLLIYINLNDNDLSGEIPSSLNNLLFLKELILSANQLSAIPNLDGLTELTNLNLSYNAFNQELPEWIGSLTKLRTLDLRGNALKGNVPSTFSNLENLRNLYLNANQLTGDLPANFNNLNLIYLNLASNQLTGSITSVISNMENLFFANLNGNEFTGIIPNFTNLSPNIGFIYVSNNRLTFEAILPNLVANVNHVENNHSQGQVDYATQTKIGISTSFIYNVGDSYTFDLDIDEAVSDNVYKWYKNGTLIQTIIGNNKLMLTNVTIADLGTYTCQVMNPGAPNLTLFSYNYNLVESIPANDNVCDAQILSIGTSMMRSYAGASNELNEPVVEGENCNEGWCNTELHGSVWYAFIAPTDPSVSIRVSGINGGVLDSKIALYEGIDCGASNPFENALLIKANDDILDEYTIGSFIRLACLNAGSLYFIQVEQYEPGQIDFEIVIEQLENCELPCNLSLLSSSITPMTCPGSNDAFIATNIQIPLGQSFKFDLYDDNNNLLNTQNYSTFGNLSENTYNIVARSLDNTNCTLEIGPFEVINAVDSIPPTTNCVSESVNVAYVHSARGNPFGLDSYNRAMDTIFQDNWQELTYELVNPQLLFSDAYNFIYLEGNHFNYYDLDTLMTNNRQLIEDWVALGNSLFINADPVGIDNYNIGFDNVLLTNFVNSTSATAVDPNHPIFLGPITPTTTTLTGEGSLGNGLLANAIVGPYSIDATPLLEAPNGDDLLVEVAWGDGTIFFGTMTASSFHQPSIEAFNLKANMLAYLAGKAIPAVNTPISLALDENQTATLTPALIDMGTFDECTLTGIQVNKTTFDCFDVGLQPITLTATDASGNSNTCTTSIMVTAPNDYCADLIGECLNERTMNSTMEDGIYPAATTFTATGMIANNKRVVFKAGTSITLLPGFHAQAGSDFTAMIEDCTPTMLQEAATERSQPILTTVLSQPKELELKAYPNPFNESTTVDYYLPTASQTQLQLMDFMGKVVQSVQPLQETATGWHQVQLNATDLPTGTYFLVLENEGEIKTRQLILVK